MMAVLIPTTFPARSISGPPEFPGLIAASVWMNDSYSVILTSFRSVAETIPR